MPSKRGGASSKNPHLPSPVPVDELLASGKLIKQGAEGKIYKVTLPSKDGEEGRSRPALLKHRFPKRYRHPDLDAQLTRQRLQAEARVLVRAARAGVRVPELVVCEPKAGVLGIEWIDGWTVREVLGAGGDEDDVDEDEDGDDAEARGDTVEDVAERMQRLGLSHDELLFRIGEAVGRLHNAEIVHGDLTTSNMMVKLRDDGAVPPVYDLYLIDFGLASNSVMSEDRAVDLYVLERAFASTHPEPASAGDDADASNFARLMKGYEQAVREYGKPGAWEQVRKRLEEVRTRGRKRSMVG